MPQSKSVSYRSEFRISQPNSVFEAQMSPTIFDIAPDEGFEGQITTVAWSNSYEKYVPTFMNGDFGLGMDSAKKTAQWLRGTLAKTKGHGVQFLTLSPEDEKKNDLGCKDEEADNYDEMAENEDNSLCRYTCSDPNMALPPKDNGKCSGTCVEGYKLGDDGVCVERTLGDDVSDSLAEIPWGLVSLGVVGLVGFKFLRS